MKEADVIVATTGVPGLIKSDRCVAIKCGAEFAADGKTINNALAFPGLFRGALKIGATHFPDAMKIAAAHAIAGQTKLDSLVPSILDRDVHQAVAEAVAHAWLEEQ